MKKATNRSIGLTPLFMLVLAQAAPAQRVHSYGNVELRVDQNDRIWSEGFAGTLVWPAWMGASHRAHSVSWLQHIAMGEYINSTGQLVTDANFGGHEAEHRAVANSLRRTVRFAPPRVVVNGVAEASAQYDAIDASLPADEMIEVRYDFGQNAGFRVTRRSYAFGHPEWSNFVLVDYVYEATLDTNGDGTPDLPQQQFRDVYFGINQGYQVTPAGNRSLSMAGSDADVWGSWTTFTGARSGRPLTMTYVWDGDNPSAAGDDTGDPATGAAQLGPTGRFLSESYVGFGPLHISTAPVRDASLSVHDATQPISIGRTRRLAVFGSPLALPSSIIRSGRRDAAAIETDPAAVLEFRYANLEYQGFGPYPRIAPGDRVRIAFAVAFGGISQETAVAEGQRYLAGQLTATQKNTLLRQGLDSLKNSLDRAAWAWDNLGRERPPTLAAPDLTVTSAPGAIELSWSAAGAQEYEVWRADSDVRAIARRITTTASTSYSDRSVIPGIDYYYAVVAKNGAASSAFALNRTRTAAAPLRPGLATTRDVRVVPNPFSLTAGSAHFSPSDPNRVRFFNLPAKARIRIFTESGKEVAQIDHTSGTADESWDLRTSANQFVSTGVYLAVIDNAETADGTALPRGIVKFIIVR